MPEPITTTDEYLRELKRQLAGADPAVIQDALNDAQDHIQSERAALEADGTSGITEGALVQRVVESFGTAEEVAQAYRETEIRVAAALAPQRPRGEEPAATLRGTSPRGEGLWHGMFGVLIDPRAYGSYFYLIFALPTGIIYFTWVVTGIALSLGLSILIIGLPFALLFLATVRALSLVEGRIVETLLGERMPRRANPTRPLGTWLERIKYWLIDPRTWSTLFYLLLRLPMGIVSFVLFTTLLSLSVGFFGGPIASRLLQEPVKIGWYEFIPPLWSIPLWWVASAVLALIALHLAVLIGRIYGSLAKAMLVRV